MPQIPREAWSDHPRWPEQVLLLGSHASFRELSSYLLQVAEAALAGEAAGPSVASVASLYRRWIAGMRSHEAYEEHKLYPYLARRWNMSFAAAEAGHELLHARHAQVLEAFAAAIEGGGFTPAVAAALRDHDEALDAHLALEEELVVPALLSLEPREFRRYTMLSISSLLAEFEAQTG